MADIPPQRLRELLAADGPFTEVADRTLEVGLEQLDVDYGHVARVVPGLDHWETIASTDTADGRFPVGITRDLQTTFCRYAVDREDTLALHDIPNQGYDAEPAYRTYGIECYATTPLTVDGEVYGTLCFANETSRSSAFEADDVAVLECLAELLVSKLDYRELELTLEGRNRLVGIFGRILRHNLRNNMTVIRGHLELLDDGRDGEVDMDRLHRNVDELVSLADKSHELRQIANGDPERRPQSVTRLTKSAAKRIETEHPNATVRIESPGTCRLRSYWGLESAVYELLENAVEHGNTATSERSPRCRVTVEETDRAVTITVGDDGPGLPEHERNVLRGVPERALDHGSGVGLWIVRWVVENHDGSIEIDDGDGTEITLCLPRPTANERLIGPVSGDLDR